MLKCKHGKPFSRDLRQAHLVACSSPNVGGTVFNKVCRTCPHSTAAFGNFIHSVILRIIPTETLKQKAKSCATCAKRKEKLNKWQQTLNQ